MSIKVALSPRQVLGDQLRIWGFRGLLALAALAQAGRHHSRPQHCPPFQSSSRKAGGRGHRPDTLEVPSLAEDTRKKWYRLSSKQVGYENRNEMATCPPPNALVPSESEGTLCAFTGLLAQQLPLTFISSLWRINKPVPIHIGASTKLWCQPAPLRGSNADSTALLTNFMYRPILCRLLLSGTFKVILQTESVRGEEGRWP